MNRKAIVIILAIVMILGIVVSSFSFMLVRAEREYVTVYPSLEQVQVDGEEKDLKIYTIKGENFFKLRDVAALLNGTDAQFSVEYLPDVMTVSLEKGESYDTIPGDLEKPEEDKKDALHHPQLLVVDGEEAGVDSYQIENANYYRMYDLGELLNFGVAYNEADHILMISSTDVDLAPVRVEPEEETLVVYGRTSCPYCLLAHDWLDEEGIDYIIKDTANDPEALAKREELKETHGCKYIPIFVYGEEVTYGFSDEVQAEILSWFE